MSINLLCDKLGIKRKNPTININLDNIQQKSRNKTSIYNGVHWNTHKKKWQAQLIHNTKKYFGGSYDNQENAAMSVNLLCDKLEIERRNPTIDIKLNTIKQPPIWYTRLEHTNKNIIKKIIGESTLSSMELEDEIEDNTRATRHDVKKLLTWWFSSDRQNPTSDYPGVSWVAGKWQAELLKDKKRYYGGLFDNEKDAAMKIDELCDQFCTELCDKLCAERKNPRNSINLNETLQVQNQTSEGTKVPVICATKGKKFEPEQSHDKEKYYDDFLTMKKKLESRFGEKQSMNETMKYYDGVFDNEKDTAMTVNWLNGKCQIECTNSTIDTDLIKDYQKTKRQIYQPIAESVCNEFEVKTENFLKSNNQERGIKFFNDAVKNTKHQLKRNSITLLQNEVEFLGEIKK